MGRDGFYGFYRFKTFGLGGFGSTQLIIEDAASPMLRQMARDFPKELRKALKSLGWMIRQELKLALMNGGYSIGQNWQELSRMHIYRRLDLLKKGGLGSWRLGSAGKTDKGRNRRTRLTLKSKLGHRKQTRQENMMSRWRGGSQGRNLRNSNPMGGKLVGSIRYRVRKDVLEIGAINTSAARSLQVVQLGARGSSVYSPEFTGDQPVTPAMRRLFWMAGVPLKKETTRLKQPERPLIYPAFRKLEPKFLPYIEEHIKEYLSKPAAQKERT